MKLGASLGLHLKNGLMRAPSPLPQKHPACPYTCTHTLGLKNGGVTDEQAEKLFAGQVNIKRPLHTLCQIAGIVLYDSNTPRHY